MRKFPRVYATVVLLLSSVLLTGCVVFYRTSDVQNSFNDGEKKVNEMVSTVETYRSEQQAGYDYLAPQLGSAKEPFPAMLASLQKISAVLDKLKTHQVEFAKTKKDFEALAATFPPGQNIQSNKPGWDEFKPIHEKFNFIVKDLNNCIDDVNDARSDLEKLEQKHHIGKTNAGEIKNQIAALISTIEQSKTSAGEKLSATDREAVEHKQTEIKQLSDEINQEVGDKTELWTAPGSLVNVKFETIRKKGDEVNGIFSKVK